MSRGISKWWQWAGKAVLIGLGATATMDLGAEVIRRTTGVPPLDYRLLGRWIGHMPQGHFRHRDIGAAAPVPAERLIGQVAHYSIGIGFACLLLASNPGWAERPTLGPAMFIGLGSVAAPFFLMQPAFGLGIAASKTPNPPVVRFRSLRAHTIYGSGLYITGRLLAVVSHWRVDTHRRQQILRTRGGGR